MEAKNIIKLSVFFALFVSLAPVSIRAAAPSAIADLYCAFSGTPGAVRLSWTVPTNTPVSYEVKYALTGISEADYSLAPAFSQSWVGSDSQGLVDNLAQNKFWFFAVKAINASGTSAISNVVTCQPNNPAASTILVTVPSSNISNLQSGSEIPAGKNYVISGSSSDAGGSSVQKVELSLDNGATWQKTTAVKQVGTGFEWQYNWLAPKAGDYSLKTRAVDWLGYQEASSTAVNIKVVEQQNQTSTAVTAASSSTATVSQTQDQDQQRRNLLIQIIQIILQLLSRK